MTLFEDLIVELKNENLLEETVVEVVDQRSANDDEFLGIHDDAVDAAMAEEFVQPLDAADPMLEQLSEMEKPVSRREFYRKRAVDEMNGLQMVEHVFSAIEREHMKIAPVPFDDLKAKMALSRFMQVSDDHRSDEHVEADFDLMKETESWNSSLAQRDAGISVANLRRFCETSQPPLSSQAMLSLARFYRNSQFSESTRAKFEFIMTRLFAREGDFQKRFLIFEYDEMIGHIKTFYGDWSSVSLYDQGDGTNVEKAVATFNGLANEVEGYEAFDDVLAAGFFDRVRNFKEATREMFFAPQVTAAAIICNARIGNKFVDLIQKERLRTSPKLTAEKYGDQHDPILSEAAGKTVNLIEVLRSNDIDIASIEEPVEDVDAEHTFTFGGVTDAARSWFKFDIFAVNRWMVVLTVVAIAASIGVYVWADQAAEGDTGVVKAKVETISDAKLSPYVKTARSTTETLYGVMQPSWNELDDKQKEELLQTAWSYAKDRGFRRILLLNEKGKTVGFAAEGKSLVSNP
jgi:hypothetical protein